MYDPRIGRFLSKDPSGTPDGLNRFQYVSNSPTNRIDQLGLNSYFVGGTNETYEENFWLYPLKLDSGNESILRVKGKRRIRL
jgi:uncharacterized protein RhaS with RHS repeats